MTEIVFVTASNLPKPDLESQSLVERLQSAGHSAAVLPWDSNTDWSKPDIIVLRTPWDYVERLAEFMAWIDVVEPNVVLANSASLIRWNAHKSYLDALARNRVDIVPTSILRQGDSEALVTLLDQYEDRDLVVKPAVGIGGYGTLRGGASDAWFRMAASKLNHADDILVQPFISGIQTTGEISLIYIGGRYSHAVRKRPRQGEYRVQDHHGGSVEPHMATEAERKLSEAALAVAPGSSLYARIDLVEHEGQPLLMELELIEPELFFRFSDSGADAFLQAVIRRAEEGQPKKLVPAEGEKG